MQGKYYDLAIVIHSLKVGGSEKFVLSLANKLAEGGVDVLLVVLETENPLLEKLDTRVDFQIMPRRFRYDFLVAFRIDKILSDNGIQTVLCVEPFSFFLTKLSELFSWRRKRNYYLSLHHSLPTYKRKQLLDILFLKAFGWRDKVIFICHFQRQCFVRHYYFRPRGGYIIYNGVDTCHFSPEKTISELSRKKLAWRIRLGIPDAEPVLIMVGRISPEKGQRYAIDALDQLYRMHGILAHLVLIGTGAETLTDELKYMAHELNIRRRVHFEGVQWDVRPYLLTGDLFTLTSISETFSLAALEAMSMGMPCSLTDVGGARELLRDDKLGDLCKPADPVSIACSWAKLLQQKTDRNYIRKWIVENYGEKNMVEDYMTVLGINRQYREIQEIA